MERIFVYGTLQPGQERWPILKPFVLTVDEDGPATARGRLYDTGYGWPAAVFDAAAGTTLPGTVLTFHPRSCEEAFATLDAVEGVKSGLFQRISIEVDGVVCWAYHWPSPTGGFQPIRCWPPRAAGR